MGGAFLEVSRTARAMFARADTLLGIPLTSMCVDGPEAALLRTENAQPALYVVGLIAATLLRERGVVPVAVAGHSVGEYTALTAAGALPFEDGLRAVRRRGELMAAAATRTAGMMAAIVGPDVSVVERICGAVSEHGRVDVANENAPDQVVISGETAAVERAMDLAEQTEGALAVPLAVAGAFHSRLMSDVVPEMARVLDAIPFRAPDVPVVANATADTVRSPGEIRETLLCQLDGRVRWHASMLRLADEGAERWIESGPGRTLARLARACVPGVTVLAAEALLRSGERNGRATADE